MIGCWDGLEAIKEKGKKSLVRLPNKPARFPKNAVLEIADGGATRRRPTLLEHLKTFFF
jgi:hypothetical protein